MKQRILHIVVIVLFGISLEAAAQQLTVNLKIEEEFAAVLHQNPEIDFSPGESVEIPFDSAGMAVFQVKVPRGTQLMSRIDVRDNEGMKLAEQQLNMAWSNSPATQKEDLLRISGNENEMIIPNNYGNNSMYLYIYGSFKVPDEFPGNTVVYDLSIDYN